MIASRKKDQSFPKSARLLKHADFEAVYKKGRRQFSANMSLFFLRPANEAERVRVGLGVGRAMGGAVARNKIKRRLREAVRRNMELLTPPLDVVINPKRSVAEMEFAELLAEVGSAFSAVEIARKKNIERKGERQ